MSPRVKAMLAVRVAEAAAGFSILAVLTTNLPPSELGYWFLIMGMIGTTQSIFEIRSTEAIFSYLPRLVSTQSFQAARQVFKSCLGVGVLSGIMSSLVLFVVIAYFSTTYFGHSLTRNCIISALLITCLRSVNLPMFATLRAVGTTRRILIAGVATHLMRCVIVAITANNFPAFEYIVIASAFAEIAVSIILALATSSIFFSSSSCGDTEAVPSRNEMFKFLGFSSLIGLSNAFVLQADILLLGLFTPVTTVATYGLARRLASMSDIFFSPVNEAVFARLSAAGTVMLREKIIFEEKQHALTLVGTVVGGMLMTAPLLHVFLGERYPGIAVTFALISFWSVWFCGHWFRPLLATLGKQKEAATFIFLSVLSFALTAPALTMAFGVTGLILSHYIRIIVWLLAGAQAIRRFRHVLQLPLGTNK